MTEILKDYFNKHQGERCFILGNGTSLNDVELEKLDAPAFGSNRIYLSGYTPKYYCCVNPLVLKQYWKDIAEMDCVKFLGAGAVSELGEMGKYKGEILPIDTSLTMPSFGNPEGRIWEGHTVTYVMMQLAYYMGFTDVILLGVDHDYGAAAQRPNELMEAHGVDKYHFHPDYFTGGAKWNAPDLQRSEIAYSLAKLAYESSGRKITNASAWTKLSIFPLETLNRIQFKTYMDTRVSCIVSAYNTRPGWTRDTIKDLIRQSENVEIVVVAQKDSQEMKETEEIFPYTDQITFFMTEDIPSVYHAWNLAIITAHGKYLTNCNTDDRRHPLALELMADLLDARPDIDIVYGDQYITWNDPLGFEEFTDRYNGNGLVMGRQDGQPGYFSWINYKRSILADGCFLGPQPMWRASLHQLYGGFLDEWKSGGDYEFWLRVSREANMLHIPHPLGVYCARADGIELGNPVDSAREFRSASRLHQEQEGMEITRYTDGFSRVRIGDRWTIVSNKDLGLEG